MSTCQMKVTAMPTDGILLKARSTSESVENRANLIGHPESYS